MGYYASEVSRDGSPLIIADMEACLARLLIEQGDNGHISWCDRIESYEGTPAERVAQILEDFGWSCNVQGDRIEVEYWKGDKLGSSWDGVCEAIAAGIDPDHGSTTIIMCGEDQEMWAERLAPSVRQQLAVRFDIVEPVAP